MCDTCMNSFRSVIHMIGVFDSGVGGLSVHRALVTRLPQADFCYFADQANSPYGGRDAREIVALTRAGCEWLFGQGASLVVLACNTAASIALRPLQQDWLPELRRALGRPANILGLIVPTIEAATGMGWNEAEAALAPAGPVETLGIFATHATVRSDVYPVEIHKRRPDIRVVQEACPELARMIEAGAPRAELAAVIRAHVRALALAIGDGSWKAVLGCTHYEIVAELFAEALPASTHLIHQPSATAEALEGYLRRHLEYDKGNNGLRRFITTASAFANPLARDFWGAPLVFESSPA